MYLSMIEWTQTDAVAEKPPTFALALAAGAHVTRRYETTGVAEDRMLWCEFDSAPHDAAAPDGRVTVLRHTQSVGADGSLNTPFVYLVHTDIAPDLLEEYNAWYGQEHLPRLVTVPGILRARRFTATSGAPQFLTAYDLTDRDAFESPAGLVARKTPWTERMRSQFTNTRRIMCRLVDALT